MRKIIELDPCCLSEMSDDYENNELFTQEHDEQLLMWLNRFVCYFSLALVLCTKNGFAVEHFEKDSH